MSHKVSNIEENMDTVFGHHGWRDVSYRLDGEKKMSEKEIIIEESATEVVSSDIEVVEQKQLTQNIFGTTNPADFVSKSQEYAKALVDVVEDRQLYAVIQGKKYVTFEGWQFLGSMLPTAITPQTEYVNEVKDENTGEILGYKARVLALDVNGKQRGASESVCMYAERNWAGKDANHLMSMAQTRASSKALRMALSSIVKLAGYEPTPKEEMDGIDASNSFTNTTVKTPQPPTPQVQQNSNSGEIKASPNKPASEPQLRWIKSLINANADSPYANDVELLKTIADGSISSAKADEIIKALK